MRDFNTHFKMSEEDVKIYAKKYLDLFHQDADLKAEEIGDGNINYVFRVWDESTGRSVIIKQADKILRSSKRPLDTDRSRIEAEALILHNKLVPGLVPKVYKYDPIMCALSMEDLSDHGNLRYELLKGKTFPKLADDITTFLVNTLLPTTDLVMDPGEKKKMVKRFINIELCDISEKLVFTEPYTDYIGRNIIIDENKEFVEELIYKDRELVLEAGKLRNNFMNNAQALIHGDLHSGSIFVREDSTKVLDHEFAFYGPMGYDIGNVVGNLFFAWVNAYTVMVEGEVKEKFLVYLENTIVDIVELFKEKFKVLYMDIVRDIMAKQDGYMEWYLDNILTDTCGVAGLEIIRRTVGDAKVADITSIGDIEKRVKAERILLLLGKSLILNREEIKVGRDYINSLKEAIEIYYNRYS